MDDPPIHHLFFDPWPFGSSNGPCPLPTVWIVRYPRHASGFGRTPRPLRSLEVYFRSVRRILASVRLPSYRRYGSTPGWTTDGKGTEEVGSTRVLNVACIAEDISDRLLEGSHRLRIVSNPSFFPDLLPIPPVNWRPRMGWI